MDVAPQGTQATEPGPVAEAGPSTGGGSRGSRSVLRDLPVLVLVAAALTLVLRLLVVQAFYIPSGSMEPTLSVGDRVLVSKLSYLGRDVGRGDVVVFDGRDSFAQAPNAASIGLLGRVAGAVGGFLGVAPSEHDFVKRVVGVGGDRVVCCDATGRLTVNGAPLDEPYLRPGEAASGVRFDVLVPPGRLWLMGDHRSDSADSRAHLGDPGGGTVPQDRVIGRVVLNFWPVGSAGRLSAPSNGERE
jgi:signal peptidase I